MMLYEQSGTDVSLNTAQLKLGMEAAIQELKKDRKISKVLAIPPDITRFHSKAGELTVAAHEILGESLTDILPALGTHYPMTGSELDEMFPGIDHSLFRPHKWREDLFTLGHVPSEFVEHVSEGAVNYSWPAQVNKLLVDGRHDLILSIGQVVPHEVIGFANHNKNIFVGTGGAEGIHKSHFLGAAYGMEKIMGRADTPVRQVLNYASDHFAAELPIVYVLTVVAPDPAGVLHVRGLFIGTGYECFQKAAELSLKVNFTMVEKPIRRAVVYLDPKEFRSTWLGNKAVYRTRMAMADGGELYIIAPGIQEFGEDHSIDALIRQFGYRGTDATVAALDAHPQLSGNLSAAAHLIHGSSEDRFSIIYATEHMKRSEIESVGYEGASIKDLLARFAIKDIEHLNTGYRRDADNEEYFFVSNPALGLWAHSSRLKDF